MEDSEGTMRCLTLRWCLAGRTGPAVIRRWSMGSSLMSCWRLGDEVAPSGPPVVGRRKALLDCGEDQAQTGCGPRPTVGAGRASTLSGRGHARGSQHG
jgi:hypothetical protein